MQEHSHCQDGLQMTGGLPPLKKEEDRRAAHNHAKHGYDSGVTISTVPNCPKSWWQEEWVTVLLPPTCLNSWRLRHLPPLLLLDPPLRCKLLAVSINHAKQPPGMPLIALIQSSAHTQIHGAHVQTGFRPHFKRKHNTMHTPSHPTKLPVLFRKTEVLQVGQLTCMLELTSSTRWTADLLIQIHPILGLLKNYLHNLRATLEFCCLSQDFHESSKFVK